MVAEKQMILINLKENLDKAAREVVSNIDCVVSKYPP